MTRYICQQNNGWNLSTYQQNLNTMIKEMESWKTNLKTMTNTNGSKAANESSSKNNYDQWTGTMASNEKY